MSEFDFTPGMHSHADQLGVYEDGERVHHATEVGRIVARYIADTASFQRGNALVRSEMQSTGRSSQKAGSKLATYNKYIALGGGAIILGALKSYADYQRNLNIFAANTQRVGQTQAQTNAILKQAGDVSKKLGADSRFPAVTAADVADTLVELSKAGLTAHQSIKAVDSVMLLGTAGQMEYADAGQIAANAMNAFHLKAKQLPAVVDDIAGAALKSSSDVKDVAEAFRYTSSAAAGLGVPINQTTTLIGLLSNLGLKGDMAGTSMRMFFTSIASPRSNPAADALAKLGLLTGGKGKHHKGGVNAFFNKDGTIKDLNEIFALWKSHTKGLTNQQKVAYEHTIFGTRGMNVGRAMDRYGGKGFQKMFRESTRAGSANRLAAANTKGLYGAYQRLVNVVQTLGLELGEYLAPYAEKVLGVLSRMAEWLEKNQKIVKDIAKAIVIVVGAYVAWRAILIAWKITQLASLAVMTAVRAAMFLYRVAMVAIYAPTALATVATEGLTAALLANPIGLIVAGIIVLILILRHFGVSMKDVTHAIQVGWAKIKHAFTVAYNFVKNTFSKHWKSILLIALTGPFGIVYTLIHHYWGRIKGAFNSAKNWVVSVFKKVWLDALILGLTGPFGPIIVLIRHKIGTIKAVIHKIVDFIVGLATEVYNAALHLGGRIKDGVVDGMKGLPGAIKDSIIGAIPGGKSASRAAGWLWKHKANGGSVYGGGAYMVGERGPELFVPNHSGSIVPNHHLGGGRGAPSVNIEHMSVRSEEDPYVIASILGNRMRLAQ